MLPMIGALVSRAKVAATVVETRESVTLNGYPNVRRRRTQVCDSVFALDPHVSCCCSIGQRLCAPLAESAAVALFQSKGGLVGRWVCRCVTWLS